MASVQLFVAFCVGYAVRSGLWHHETSFMSSGVWYTANVL